MTPVDLRALYAVPPAEFVAQRAVLVRTLKAEGRKQEAAAVQQLRRPRLAEAALNLVARSHAGAVDAWASAASAVDAAQSLAIGGGGAGQLREASTALRAAHAAVLDAAVRELGDSGPAQRDEIAETLRSLAHPQGVPLLQAGVVGSQQLGDLVLFAGAPEPVVNRRPAGERAQPNSMPKGSPAARAPSDPKHPATPAPSAPAPVDGKRLRALERAARAARDEAERSEVALHAARAAVAAAKVALAAATDRAAAARGSARAAEQAIAALRADQSEV